MEFQPLRIAYGRFPRSRDLDFELFAIEWGSSRIPWKRAIGSILTRWT